MVDACITVALNKDFATVWPDQIPTAFGSHFAELQNHYNAIVAKAALAESAGGGAADTKAVAEIVLETNAYVLARTLAFHFKQANDLTRRAQVDVSRSEIVQLRENDLVSKATTLRDLGLAALAENGAADHGLTPARIDALTAAIVTFKATLATPRGQIVNRSTLLKEVETDTASLLEQLRDLDDLVVQFDGSPAGLRFSEAWKHARAIIDRTGEAAAKKSVPPAPLTTAPVTVG